MKYKNIVCIGHPRSGTHYITALISTNFLNDPDYLKIYGNHGLPQIACDPNVVYIHIWREFKGVAKSIYVLRESFGLDVDSYVTRYKDMRKIKRPNKLITNVRTLAKNTIFPGVVDFFQEVDMKPQEYWEYYNTLWANSRKNNPNIVSIKYNNVLEDFNGTMAYIAESLDSDVAYCNNITRRVGWWK